MPCMRSAVNLLTGTCPYYLYRAKDNCDYCFLTPDREEDPEPGDDDAEESDGQSGLPLSASVGFRGGFTSGYVVSTRLDARMQKRWNPDEEPDSEPPPPEEPDPEEPEPEEPDPEETEPESDDVDESDS
ncbi:unnamed protein product [Dibothriocephalus latus]|uniref:Uncharacterized protein n=1 Tax=Dibothriocephalus latus TaxID=60516 RepID=A0A3P7NR98_DIBLA|nr:unnamed protein product [Dibothriocephalus latus]